MRVATALLAVSLIVLGCGARGESAPNASAEGPTAGPGDFAVATIAPEDPASPAACPAASLEGELAVHLTTGLGLRADDRTVGVVWPFGYRGSGGPPVGLIDPTGTVVAVLGDTLTVGGGELRDGIWLGCGGVSLAE